MPHVLNIPKQVEVALKSHKVINTVHTQQSVYESCLWSAVTVCLFIGGGAFASNQIVYAGLVMMAPVQVQSAGVEVHQRRSEAT